MFDSGVGGLTVARAVIDLLPHEDLIYFGDTRPVSLRPPACGRGPQVRARDHGLARGGGREAARHRVQLGGFDGIDRGPRALRRPVISVIEPGTKAAVAATRNRRIGLIGTEATVASGAYDRAVAETRANVELISKAVLASWSSSRAETRPPTSSLNVAEEYLAPLKEQEIDTLILGCTHYPLLTGVIQYVMGEDVVLISSAEVTANEVYAAPSR